MSLLLENSTLELSFYSDKPTLHTLTFLQSVGSAYSIFGSPQSLDWNGGMEWWNGIVNVHRVKGLLESCFLLSLLGNKGPEGPWRHRTKIAVVWLSSKPSGLICCK